MSLASSSSLILDQNDLPPTTNETNDLPDDVENKPLLLLQADSPLIISGLSIVDNGRNLVKEIDTSQPFVSTEIILNLILTATVHHNITINKLPQNNCSETCTKSNCSQECIKYFIDVIGWDNVLKYANQTDVPIVNKSIMSFANKYNIDKYVNGSNENRSDAAMNSNEIVSDILQKREKREEVTKELRKEDVKDEDGKPCSGIICKTVRSKRDVDLKKFSPSLSLIKSIVSSSKIDKFIAETSTNPKNLQNDEHTRVVDYHSNFLAREVMTKLRNNYCFHPEYIIFTWVLCLIALATALKLYYLIKTFLAIIMVALYTILILVPFDLVFNDFISNGDLER